jgi:hypothetical protein
VEFITKQSKQTVIGSNKEVIVKLKGNGFILIGSHRVNTHQVDRTFWKIAKHRAQYKGSMRNIKRG